jgi:hypothetical protein
MLTVRNPRPEPTLRDWLKAHRTELVAHTLWAIALIGIAALAQSDDLVALFAAILEVR